MANNQGRHWLLLRGLARESAHWGDFTQKLTTAFPADTLSALDLPGTGRLYQQTSPHTISAIAGQVRAHALAEGWLAKPVTLVAISLGAMVAWEWLRTYPDDCCAAILMNTSFANLSPFHQRLRWQSYGKFCALLQNRGIYQRELAIVRLVSNRPEYYQAVARDWATIQTMRPLALKNVAKQLMAAASFSPGPTPPNAPVLLLNSKGDRLVSPACSEAIQNRYALELHTHPWAGHDLTLDDGDWAIAQMQAWLAQR